MVRNFCIATAILLAVFIVCKKSNLTEVPEVTTELYTGSLYDSTLAAIFRQAHMNYNGTQYKYAIRSDGNFKVDENIGMGWTSPSGEEGTYVITGAVYTFTPVIDRRDDQASHQMVATDSLRPVYTGVIASDTLTINNFINIENKVQQRNLGKLVLKRQ